MNLRLIRPHLLQLLVMVLCMVQCLDSFGQTPPAEDIGSEVQKLWDANQITDLQKYLIKVEDKHPKYVPAMVAAAFYEHVFKGEVRSAMKKLEQIQNDTKLRPELYSEEFIGLMKHQMNEFNEEIEILTNSSWTEEQWRAAVDPQKLHDYWVQKLPGLRPRLIRVINCSPKIFIQS